MKQIQKTLRKGEILTVQKAKRVSDYILLLYICMSKFESNQERKEKNSCLYHTSFPCRHLLSRYCAVINGSIDDHTNLIIYSYGVSG